MNLNLKGKIGRLPGALREEVNVRLRNDETGRVLAGWLKSIITAPQVEGYSPQDSCLWDRKGSSGTGFGGAGFFSSGSAKWMTLTTGWPEFQSSSSIWYTPSPTTRTTQTGSSSCRVQMRLEIFKWCRLESLAMSSNTSSPCVASNVMRAPFSSEPNRLAKARKMSDSVMIPASVRARSTGSAPILCSHIYAAATSSGVSGETVFGLAVMISATVVRVTCGYGPSVAKGLPCGGKAWICLLYTSD